MRLEHLSFALVLLFMVNSASAFFNVTYLNTTVMLNTNNSAHVVESLTLYMSNTSISTYDTDRSAINVTLTGWQKALNTDLLVEHILSPKASIYGFEFLPGPPVEVGNGAYATLTMSYFLNNVTSMQVIAPRKFEYSFNNTVFNFKHSASGQNLMNNAKLTIILPKGAKIVDLYPAPDYPRVGFISNYTQYDSFSWYAGEPLSSFALTYIITQTPGQEVIGYFDQIYASYSTLIYLILAIVLIGAGIYMYVRIFGPT